MAGVLDLSFRSLRAGYATGRFRPSDIADELKQRVAVHAEKNIWIHVSETLLADAEVLDARDEGSLPLYGVPFALKDNIDIAGVPTTAGCPEFAYTPDASSPIVQKLLKAGALFVGKANMDQFATGLNGTRTPYGVVHSAHNNELIAGGSSSGSAVSVALGLAAFALGTDTAGSGRVPAALNGVVGLKPTVGMVSGRGVVPNCRTIDTSSIFTKNVSDAALVHSIIAGFDAGDPWSARFPLPSASPDARDLVGLKLAVPTEVPHWGTRGERETWDAVTAALVKQGAVLEEHDFSRLYEAGRQMYLGPWVAERVADLHGFLSENRDIVHPSVRALYESSDKITARDTYAALHRLYELRREASEQFSGVDAVLSPTVPATFTIDEVMADPVRTNEALGTFTTFTNLIGLCSVSVPVGLTIGSAVPFSLQVQTFEASDDRAAGIALAIEQMFADEA
ncbi:allophanate hydrolase [Arthrobacter sp. AB6]|uniref:allophanate hydrolase n=1 Tax=Arthrobacter sp. AB6 TaxID=2962570 RepID=UPI002881340B|nr:allophanate hydrolase [Arthrobacter sp. AB6]MDT0196691.1 allophanate hydrolase [Arthrobacter sp. AB6]